MKKELEINIIEPLNMEDFYLQLGKVMLQVWKDKCPKDIQKTVLEKIEEMQKK